ncbi:MAG TPA: chemotaxis protein CheB [Thiobacillus sp.]|nr:chemotaxis protein CheB [Thiobacillus sp.]
MPVKKTAPQEKPGQAGAERARFAANRRKAAPSSPNTENTESTAQPLQAVVGMVASAGGLEAFKQFFQAMPADSGIAFVLIPHLDPKHESLMAPLLDKQTAMPVVEARDGQRLEADHVYVIPPNHHLTLHKGVIQLSAPPDRGAGQTAIDPFLCSLAADQQERAICIILSGTGTGSHGSLGLKAVKAEGGMAMVQEPSSAEYNGMPLSAIDAGLADYVLPPGQMPEELLKYVQHFVAPAAVVINRRYEALQSAIEKLSTVNSQLRDKVDELENSNNDMTNLLASVDNATLFLGVDRTIQRFTLSATRLFNLIATDVGRPIDHITARFEDPELSRDIDRVLQILAPCEREVSRGGEQWFLRRITPYRIADNRIGGVVLSLTDITQIKRAELELRDLTAHLEQRVSENSAQLQHERNFIDAIVNTVGAMILVIDTEERLVRFNTACNTTTGYDFAEFQGSSKWQNLIPADEQDGVRRVNDRLRSGEDHIRHENHWLHRDGSMRLISWCNSALRDEAGQVQHIICTGIDITEQRHAENRARETLEEASRLQRLQTANELATLLAHELNQPLAAIATYAETGKQLLRHMPLDHDRLAANLERISQQSLRAGEAIRHLRAFVGRGRIDPVPTDLNAVARSTCTLMAPKARARGVDIALDLTTLPPVLAVDVHIEQVLLNLLRNAIDAIRDANMSSGSITVTTRRFEDMAQVSVIDSGPGIDAAVADKVFEPLASHKEYGLGVGLRISRSLIEAHGGRLWVEPHTPGGIFHFVLPFAP